MYDWAFEVLENHANYLVSPPIDLYMNTELKW